MKKVLSLIIAVMLVVPVFSAPAISASAASEDYSRQEALLSNLNIIDGGEDLSTYVTRGEFAKYLSKLMNIIYMPDGYKLPYTDVPATHPSFEGIYNLYAWRVISDSESFRPDDKVTTTEAAKMIVSCLGYDFMANSLGGYPGGYISAATRLGVMPKGDANGIMLGEAFAAMYEMLHTNLPTVDIGGNGNNEYYSKSGDTVLEDRWNLSMLSGTVEDGQFFGLNQEDGVGEGKTAIGGYLFENGGFDTDSMIGDYVDVYYDKDAKIVSIYAEKDESSKNVTILSSQEIKFSDRTYSWFEDDKEETRKISKSCVIVYNGKRVDYDKDLMVPEFGSVKLISQGSSEADIVVIKSYIQAVAGAINTNDMLISDTLHPGTSYVMDDEITVYLDQNGNTTAFDSIAQNDVLWIAENADGEYTDVIICRDYITGQITGTSKDSSAIYIDNRKFDATEEVLNTLSTDYQMGSIVKCLINPDGKIISLINQNAGSTLKTGYLMYSQMRSRGLSFEVRVKILGTDNAIVTYTLPSKFLLNGVGVNVTNEEEYYALPLDEFRNKAADGTLTSMKCSIITFEATPKNELTAINYPNNVDIGFPGAKDLGLFPTHSITDTEDKYVQFIGDDRAIVNKGNERIFVNGSMPTRFYVPMLDKDNTSPEDEYYKYQTFPKGYQTGMKHYGYSTTANSLMSNHIVSEYPLGGASGESIPKTATLYMVTGISQIINSEGEEVEQLTCQTAAGVEKNFYSTELGYIGEMGLEFGDLVKVVADIKSNLEGIQIIYKAGENKLTNESKTLSSSYSLSADGCQLNADSGMGTLGYLITLGNAYRSDGTFFELLFASNDINGFDPKAEGAPKLYCYSASRETVTLINKKAETYTIGGGEVIKSYYDFGSQCSTVVVETYAGSTLAIFVYEN